MPRGSREVPRMIPEAIAHPRSTVSFAQDVVTQFGAIGLSSIPANNRLILRRSSRLRSGSFATLSLARVSSSSRSSSANSFSSFSATELLNQRRCPRVASNSIPRYRFQKFPTNFSGLCYRAFPSTRECCEQHAPAVPWFSLSRWQRPLDQEPSLPYLPLRPRRSGTLHWRRTRIRSSRS